MILSISFLVLVLLFFVFFIFYIQFFLKQSLPSYTDELTFATDSLNKESFSQKDQKKGRKQNKKAFVFCSPDKTFLNSSTNYAGYKDCFIFKKFHEAEFPCTWGCFGFGSCVAHCPQDAIIIKNNTAIITENCDGCGICIDICPNNVIQLVPDNDDYLIACSSHDGENTECSRACTGCAICVDNSYYSGFKVKDSLAFSDYIPNKLKESYSLKCPQKSIVKIRFPSKKDFKFWRFWYIIKERIIGNKNRD